jgi:hypothetical protein
VLVLQHPQEPDKLLGTARLAHLALPSSTLAVGLSWPNLKAALKRDAQPSRWAVLHLGSGVKEGPVSTARTGPTLQFVDKRGHAIAPIPSDQIDGLVVLDGTWSQAKALWWRNPWLLKLKRAILLPTRTSLYGELRSEPRRECLSTIESIAQSLTALGEPPSVEESLVGLLATLIERYRQYAF